MDTAQATKAVLRYGWIVVILAVVAGVVAFFVSNTLPKQYSSQASVLVGSLTESDLQQQLGFQELAQTYASLADEPIVLAPVIVELGLDGSFDSVAARVSANTFVDGNVVRVVATAATPAEAAALAGAVAEGLVDLAREAPLAPSLAQIVEPAAADDDPTSPSILINSIVAAALGLALGLLIALALGARREARQRSARPMPPGPPVPAPPPTYPR
jgi:capsular polysaccharide biosynthesis protein